MYTVSNVAPPAQQTAPDEMTLDLNSTSLEETCKRMAGFTRDKSLECDLLLLAETVQKSSRNYPDAPVAVPLRVLFIPERFYGWMMTHYYKRTS